MACSVSQHSPIQETRHIISSLFYFSTHPAPIIQPQTWERPLVIIKRRDPSVMPDNMQDKAGLLKREDDRTRRTNVAAHDVSGQIAPSLTK